MKRADSRVMAGLLAAAVVLAFADASVVVLALPEMYAELDTTIVGVSWVITAYAVVVTAVGFGLAATPRRGRALPVTLTGLALFAAASIACTAAGSVGTLTTFRCLQGVGGALLLVGSLDVLRALHPSGARLWASAGTVGLAVGPALGGVLTDLFDWRVVFAVQAPVAALAMLVALSPAARAGVPPPPPAGRHTPRERRLANAGLVLVSGGLVGALFLAVLLVIEVWRYSPINGALVVSALPAGALLATRAGARAGGAGVRAVGGSVLLAAGLVGLALLPSTGPAWAGAALALCGAGLGLVSPVLEERTGEDRRASGLTIGCRHLGLVLGLVLFAPMLATGLDRAAEHAALAGTAAILDAEVGLREKVSVATSLRDQIEDAPKGQMPNLEEAFAGRSDDAERAGAEMQSRIQGVLTRAFRPEFLVAALLALGAAAPCFFLTRHSPPGAPLVVGVLLLAAGGLVAGELASGAGDYGRYRERDPCNTGPDPYPGTGLDAALQRIALSGLDGAACDLKVTREALVLSLDGDTGLATVDWDRRTVQRAVRSGMVRAIDDADERNSIPGWAAGPLKELAERAPIEFALDANDKLKGGLDSLKRLADRVLDFFS